LDPVLAEMMEKKFWLTDNLSAGMMGEMYHLLDQLLVQLLDQLLVQLMETM